MPDMDGFEATAAIRAHEASSGQHLPIIAMTAHSMKGDRERCLASGMDGYISKPINAEELMQVIEGCGGTGIGTRLAVPRELFNAFVRDCSQLVAEIRKALDQESPYKLQTAAHSMQGALMHFGKGSAWKTALSLEKLGEAGSLNGARELFSTLELSLAAFNRAEETPREGPNLCPS